MLHNVCENCARILEEEMHRQLSVCSLSCEKKKNERNSSINQSVKSHKQCVLPRILQKWCVKRHQHQFIVVLNNWTFRRHHLGEFCIKIPHKVQLVQELKPIDHSMRLLIAKWAFDQLQKMPTLPKKKKKIIFSDESHFDLGGYVNKQNYRIWGTENPHACIELRFDTVGLLFVEWRQR